MNLLLILCLAAAAPQTRNELIRQARQALVRAEQAAVRAGQACKDGEYETCAAMIEETRISVERSKESLDKTGINPHRNPRHFKDAEIRVRKILKLLLSLAPYIHPDDRSQYDTEVRRVSDVNDKLLSGILEKKKRK
jgi:hypothetical protein